MIHHSRDDGRVYPTAQGDSDFDVRAETDSDCVEEARADAFDHFVFGAEFFRQLEVRLVGEC